MKNWKVLITICVLGCTRICAQETGANDTVSRHPLTHGVGIDFRPVYLIPTNEFFAGENAAWQPLRKSVSAHLKYSFRFHPDSRYGKLYPHTYQGMVSHTTLSLTRPRSGLRLQYMHSREHA